MARIIRLSEVLEKTGLCRSAIYAQIRAGKFPKQIKLTERSSGWLESEVNQWIEARVSEREEVA